MDMDEYQAKTRETAEYPNAFSGDIYAVNYTLLGMAGEVGEMCNKWKKVLRGDYAGPEIERHIALLKIEMRIELGDVLWYVARLAEELGGTLDVIAANNIAKLAIRKHAGLIKGSGDHREDGAMKGNPE